MRGLEKLKSDISEFGSVVRDGSASDEHTLTDRGTQTDDIHLPDPENTPKHLKLPEAANNPAPLPQFDAGTKTYCLETGTGTKLTLQCPKLQLDAARANTDRCHVTTVGQLVNSPPATQYRHSGRLGNIGVHVPPPSCPFLHPPLLSPLSHTHHDTGRHTLGWVWCV
ncbi:uncharacterized protein LOC124276387 [Haliotis rubra]|uniref:uncharacterized protein LOC124276387 n=1 Tax=Haliotis rubra TaxID=36100 RepID=UPI001EE58E00|nr:uncharacterized protein LOC124276387 [Haliotis rubra]